MATPTKFFVHDKSRKLRAVTGQENYDEAIQDGFREVTAEAWDAFQVETRRLNEARVKQRE